MTPQRPPFRPRPPRGITLVETVIAVSLTTFAASALLTTLSSSVLVTSQSLNTLIASGLADQLMDEIATAKFPSGTGSSPAGIGRTGFDDLDDYHGYSVSPPQSRSGLVIGTEGMSAGSSTMMRPAQFQPNPRHLNRFRQQVTVDKVVESGTGYATTTQNSALRRVTVTISYTDVQGVTTVLATQVRIFSNVASAP